MWGYGVQKDGARASAQVQDWVSEWERLSEREVEAENGKKKNKNE